MKLHIKSLFDCVFMINGEFFERADTVMTSEFDVVYVTALPLKPTLLSYTVKLPGAAPLKTELADGIRLGRDDYLLTLSPRYMTVYDSAKRDEPALSPSPVTRLFSLVKVGDLAAAYAMLSDSLRATVDAGGLKEFFAPYERLEETYWQDGKVFYLIDKNGNARPHSFELKDGCIDNIEELLE